MIFIHQEVLSTIIQEGEIAKDGCEASITTMGSAGDWSEDDDEGVPVRKRHELLIVEGCLIAASDKDRPFRSRFANREFAIIIFSRSI